MRGTLPLRTHGKGPGRIIPAHAGNSDFVNCSRRKIAESSPRMRGTRGGQRQLLTLHRIIPAHAGNSNYMEVAFIVENGSSPRMRGTPVDRLTKLAADRIIPAHAGNSTTPVEWLLFQTDHPRACGELNATMLRVPLLFGSSPRMRGTHVHRARWTTDHRIIPAHAGNSCGQPGTSQR